MSESSLSVSVELIVVDLWIVFDVLNECRKVDWRKMPIRSVNSIF